MYFVLTNIDRFLGRERGKKVEKLIAKNPTARHNYTIESTFEAGIVLSGTEVKSIKSGKVNIKDTYVMIKMEKLLF